jgi:acyl carrier protein
VQLQVRYSTRRDITSGRLFDNPVTLERISAATAAISAVEALAYGTAALLDAGNDVPDELFVACKIIGPELLWKVADGTVQTLGGRGYIETNVLPQLLRDARVLRIFEGPTEVMLAHLGSALVKKSPGVATILTEHCDSPDLLAELSVLAESTTGAVSHHMADLGPTSPSYLAHQHLGRAVAYAVIVGMLRGETAKDPAVGHALIWAEERLQAACRAARHGYPDHLMGPGDLLARVTEYSRAIGMVDQNPAGIGERLDALLAPDLSEERTPVSPSQIAGGPPVVPAPSALDAEAQQRIRRWLIAWVAEYTGTPANAIDPDQPFLRHGLDSVGLLALSGELERYLETSLAPSLLWDFPTITNLSRELAVQS